MAAAGGEPLDEGQLEEVDGDRAGPVPEAAVGLARSARSEERSEYSITSGRPSVVTTTPTRSSGWIFSTTLKATSASAWRCRPM